MIADNVGDNVGDCAGMAADLFETYAVTLIATMVLGALLLVATGADERAVPAGAGRRVIVASIIGTSSSRPRRHEERDAGAVQGAWPVAGVLSLIAFCFVTTGWDHSRQRHGRQRQASDAPRFGACAVIGLV